MAATTTPKLTVADLERLPETGPFYYELRNGELVQVTRPKAKHFFIQRRLRRLLEPIAGDKGVVETKVAFRAQAEHELRVADVAYVSMDRWQSIDPEDQLIGAPDLAIEVLSPSNTYQEIGDKERLCLANGSQEFWVVDPMRMEIRITRRDGGSELHHMGERLPVRTLGGELNVDDVFAGKW